MLKIASVLIGGLLTMCSMMVHAEASVSLSESRIKSKVGSVISVDLTMSGFTATEGGGVDIKYNPSVLQINNVTVDENTWSFASRDGEINNNDGTVSGVLFSSYQGESGNVKIATIELEIIGRGRGKIVLSESDDNPFASSGEQIAVTFKPTRVQVRR